MSGLISQMINEKEFVTKKIKKTKRCKNYNGNLVELRKRREKLLIKKHRLNLEIKNYNKMKGSARNSIFKNIEELTNQIGWINKEIAKIQEGMQNSGNWLNGDYMPN